MIRLVTACVAVLACPPAWAGAWSADTDRILADPAFLPLAGQVYGSFSYDYARTQLQTKPDAQTPASILDLPTTSEKIDGNAFLPALGYGVTDDVFLSANLGFGNQRSSETYTAAGYRFYTAPLQLPPVSGSYSPGLPIGRPNPRLVIIQQDLRRRSIGADDPGFTLVWRAEDERRAPVNVDLTISYAPDIFQARGSSPGATGTRAFGGQAGAAGLEVSREMRLLTVAAYGTFTYDGRRDFGSLGEVQRDGAHPSYSAGVRSQIRLLPLLAVNTGVEASQAARFDALTIATQGDTTFRTSETIRPARDIAPYAGLVFPILGSQVVGEVLYEHEFFGREKQFYAFGSGSAAFNHDASLYTARLRFVFGAGRIF